MAGITAAGLLLNLSQALLPLIDKYSLHLLGYTSIFSVEQKVL